MFMLLDTTIKILNKSLQATPSCCLTLHSTQGDGPRFSRSQIQQTACLARTMPALNCSDVALVTRHAWSQLTQSYWNIVLLTETMFLTTKNPGRLPPQSQIQQIHAESGSGRIWYHDTIDTATATLNWKTLSSDLN